MRKKSYGIKKVAPPGRPCPAEGPSGGNLTEFVHLYKPWSPRAADAACRRSPCDGRRRLRAVRLSMTMDFPAFYIRIVVELLWNCGWAIGRQFVYYGITMELLWNCYGIVSGIAIETMVWRAARRGLMVWRAARIRRRRVRFPARAPWSAGLQLNYYRIAIELLLKIWDCLWNCY